MSSLLSSPLSPKERANFATGTRLLSCAINEELVEAIYVPYGTPSALTEISKGNSAIGFVFVLSPNFNKNNPTNDIKNTNGINGENDDEGNIFVIRVNHKPLPSTSVIRENDGIENGKIIRINHINPWDIIPSIFQVQIPLNPESNNLLNKLNSSNYYSLLKNLVKLSLERIAEEKAVVGPLEIWNTFARWLGLRKDLVEFFASELESSVKYQGNVENVGIMLISH